MSVDRLLGRLRWAVLTLHLGLAAALFALIARSGSMAALLLGALAVLPLLPGLPGLLRGRGYTASWNSMLVAFYCALLLAEAYMQPAYKPLLLALAALAALHFVLLMLYAKGAKAIARERGGRSAGL
jgi:uncharacterized membrane protein